MNSLQNESSRPIGQGDEYSKLIGDIVDLIRSLPIFPTQFFLRDWIEFVIEEAIGHTTAREFYHKLTKLRVRFDPKKEGAPGFEGKDHWQMEMIK